MTRPSIEDTAQLSPVRPDMSWFALAVASLFAIAFVAGAYIGATKGRLAPARSPSSARANAALGRPATSASTEHPLTSRPLTSSQATLLKAPERVFIEKPGPTDEYLLVASTTPSPPSQPPIALPASAQQIFVHYSFPDWPASARIEAELLRDGKKAREVSIEIRPTARAGHARGVIVLSVPPKSHGFKPGIYQVFLHSAAGLEDSTSFVVLADLDKILQQTPPPGGLIITDAAVTPSLTDKGTPTARVTKLTAPSQVYYWFAYDSAVEDTVVELRWSLDGKMLDVSSKLRLKGGTGTAAAYIKCEHGTLPAGQWSVGIYLEGAAKPLAVTRFIIRPLSK